MKKFFLICLIFISTNLVNAQDKVKFNLQSDGTFISDEGKEYIIVQYEGKTAQELYSIVKSKIITLYNSPKTVLSENEPINLSIRALSENLYNTYKLGGGFVSYKVYYNLVFHFKDGRIRVDAPIVDQKMDVTATGVPLPKTFASLIDDWFDKKGNVKSKKAENIEKIEHLLNYPINYLLGKSEEKASAESEDW